ncbi:MAG: trigger factor [Candidatus Omnitrophica bacterium]|nr:trigger factor [Candidatus Omnitrophota bacterium]
MKTQVKKLDRNKRELTIEVSGDILKNKFEDVYKHLGEHAKVKGFRPGNVPRDVLEKHYSAPAREEVIRQLIPEVYNQALAKESLEPVSMPDIADVNLGADTLSFKATVEVKPKIELKNYKGLKTEYKPIEIKPEEMSVAIDKIKENFKEITDESWVRSLGYPKMDDLKAVLEKQLYLEKVRAQRVSLENGIIEQLTKQAAFDVPQSLINQHLEELIKQVKVDLAMRGMQREEIEKQEPALRENLKKRAESDVRVFLILEEVARLENIPNDEHVSQKTMEFLLKNAKWDA